jgi:hypothetical protein
MNERRTKKKQAWLMAHEYICAELSLSARFLSILVCFLVIQVLRI